MRGRASRKAPPRRSAAAPGACRRRARDGPGGAERAHGERVADRLADAHRRARGAWRAPAPPRREPRPPRRRRRVRRGRTGGGYGGDIVSTARARVHDRRAQRARCTRGEVAEAADDRRREGACEVGALVAEQVERPPPAWSCRSAPRRARSRRRCCGRRSCSRAADKPARARRRRLPRPPAAARSYRARASASSPTTSTVASSRLLASSPSPSAATTRDVAQRPPGAGFGRDRVDDDLDGAASAQQRQFAARLTVAAAIGRAVS